MIQIALVFIAGMAVMLGVAWAFYRHVGTGLPLSACGNDWGVFGDYFGGVAGTVLAFISVLLLVYTILQQRKQIELTKDEALKVDVLRFLSKLDDDIESWLRRELACDPDQLVEFGDIVRGIVKPNGVNQRELSSAAERLLQLTCQYCSAIALYKDNVNAHFICQYHSTKAEELVGYLEKNLDKLGQMSGPSLAFCKIHLNE